MRLKDFALLLHRPTLILQRLDLLVQYEPEVLQMTMKRPQLFDGGLLLLDNLLLLAHLPLQILQFILDLTGLTGKFVILFLEVLGLLPEFLDLLLKIGAVSGQLSLLPEVVLGLHLLLIHALCLVLQGLLD